MKSAKRVLRGVHFAVTGKIWVPRKQFIQLVLNAGAEYDSSVGPLTHYLVLGDLGKRPTTRKKLDSRTARIISEDEFSTMLREAQPEAGLPAPSTIVGPALRAERDPREFKVLKAEIHKNLKDTEREFERLLDATTMEIR